MTLRPANEIASKDAFIEQLGREQTLLVEKAIEWLNEYSTSPQTFRSYRKELFRFFLWLKEEGHVEFMLVSTRVLQQYYKFLRNPQPSEKWCAPRNIRKSDPRWKPFEGPLSEKAIIATRHALSSFFSFLVERGVIPLSPVPRIRVRQLTDNSDVAPKKYLPESVLAIILSGLLRQAESVGHSSRAAYILRKYFVVVFMLSRGGFRREELCGARFQHLYVHKSDQGFVVALQVLGKGAAIRDVLLPPAALEILFWLEKGTPPESLTQAAHWAITQPSSKHIISTSLNKDAPLTAQGVYDCVRRAMELCADDARLSPAERQTVLKATPHWLRRTYATEQLAKKVPVKHVQAQLGHASPATTLMYQVSGAFARWEALFLAGTLSEETFFGKLVNG